MRSQSYQDAFNSIVTRVDDDGIPCGKGFIAKNKKCRSGNSKNSKNKSAKASLPGGGVAAIAATSSSAGILVGALGVVGLGAGISYLKAKQLRDDYHSNFNISAEMAREQAKDIDPPKLGKDKHTVIFAVGGWGTDDAFSESEVLKKGIESLGVKGLHIEPIAYEQFNVSQMIEAEDLELTSKGQIAKTSKKFSTAIGQATGLFVETVMKRKRNPVAVNVAAQVMAFKKKNPDKNYFVIGHSGGGLTVQEAHHVLKSAKIDTPAIAIGAPDIGLIPKSSTLVTATSKNDQVLKPVGGRGVNGRSFDNVASHGQKDYFADNEFRDFLRQSITPQQRKDAKCSNNNKPCGKICIPQESECRIGKNKKSKVSSPNATNALNAPGVGAATSTIGGLLAATGVSVLAYKAAIAKYKSGIPAAAQEAVNRSKKIDPKTLPDFKGKDGIVLAMPGFSGHLGATQQRDVERLYGDKIAEFAGKAYGTHTISNQKFNVGEGVPDYVPPGYDPSSMESLLRTISPAPVDKKVLFKNLIGTLVDPIIAKGRNEQAVDSTAVILAMRDKFEKQNPGKKPAIKAVALSAGGIIGADMNMQLRSLGMKDVDIMMFGSPYLGVGDQTPNITRYFSANDKVVGKLPSGNAKRVDRISNHLDYLFDADIRSEMSDWFKKKPRSDAYHESRSQVIESEWHKKKDSGLSGSRSSAVGQRLLMQLQALLNRAIGNVSHIGKLASSLDGNVTGMFRSGKDTFRFSLKNDQLTYKTVQGERIDSYLEQLQELHLDATKKKARCRVGIACGAGCVSRNKACKLKLQAIANPNEIMKLRQTAISFKLEQNPSSTPQPPTPNPQKPDYVTNPRTGQEYSIRELKELAKQRQVYQYSNMKKEELRTALKATDENPEQQRRISRTLGKDRGLTARAIKASGLGGRSNGARAARNAAVDANKTWKNLAKLAEFATSAPVGWGAAAIGAFLLGTTIRGFEQSRAQYRLGFKESARQAQERALNLGNTGADGSRGALSRAGNKTNITFVVGSNRAENNKSHAETIQENLLSLARSNDDESDKWFINSNHYVPFDLKETGSEPGKTPIETAVSTLKGYVGNLARGKDQDAIDLAAQLYAYGIQRKQSTKHQNRMAQLEGDRDRLGKQIASLVDQQSKLGELLKATDLSEDKASDLRSEALKIANKVRQAREQSSTVKANLRRLMKTPDRGDRGLANEGKNINILAYSKGGQTAKTALEILARMEVKGEPSGKKILEQVNLVMLGTPHFGFTENVSKRQRTIISAQDPISMLPVFGEGARQQWISSVKGHKVEDYLSDANVRESIRESFGYYQDSVLQLRRKQNSRRDSSGDHSVAVHLDMLCSPGTTRCGEICLPKEKTCQKTAAKKPKKSRFRERLNAKVGRGAIAGTVGGIGTDLERAYIKTERLVKKAIRKIQGKELEGKDQLIDDLKFEVKHLGVSLGQGTISKKLKQADEKLIDLKDKFQETDAYVKQKIQETDAYVQEKLKVASKLFGSK